MTYVIWMLPAFMLLLASCANSRIPAAGERSFYDPQPMPTERSLEPCVKDFDAWANDHYTKPLVKNLFAKRQGPGLVLYVFPAEKFFNLPKEIRLQLIYNFWLKWSTICQEKKLITHENHARIILLDKEQHIVGGNSEGKGERLWVGEKK